MDAPLISAARYNANRDASMRQPAECIRCGATITEDEKPESLPAWNEDATTIYWICGACDERNRRELAGPY